MTKNFLLQSMYKFSSSIHIKFVRYVSVIQIEFYTSKLLSHIIQNFLESPVQHLHKISKH